MSHPEAAAVDHGVGNQSRTRFGTILAKRIDTSYNPRPGIYCAQPWRVDASIANSRRAHHDGHAHP